MTIPCLLDANSVVKYYHNEFGSETVKYLIDRSPSSNVNLLNIHVGEVVSTFYKLQVKGKISEGDRKKLVDLFLLDIGNGKINLWPFKEEHLTQLLEVFDKTFSIPPPRKGYSWIRFNGGVSRELKDIADTNDVLMLIAMGELRFINRESYLFTSDGHVILVARSLGFSVIDPERTAIGGLPKCLDARVFERPKRKVKVVCSNHEGTLTIGTGRTFDLTEGGAYIHIKLRETLTPGTPLHLCLTDFNDKTKTADTKGEIVWSDTDCFGVKFFDQFQVELVCSK